MHHSLVKPATWILGVVLLLVGIAGFFVGDMLLAFQVDPVHNAVHVLSGVIAMIAASKGYVAARLYLIIFGIVYALVAFLGFTQNGDIFGYFTVNDADNYLHAAIAAISLVLGFGTHERHPRIMGV